MAIYLDTNVICKWRNFDTADRMALSIAAGQLGQRVVVPDIAAMEAIAHRERELTAVVERYEQAELELKQNFEVDDLFTEVMPNVQHRLDEWRRSLEQFSDILPADPEDAVQALTREARGQAPAKKRVPKKPGMGARDAAIWLAVIRNHRDRGEPGFFVSENTSDFVDGTDPKPELVEDLAGCSHPLEIKRGAGELLEAIGTSAQTISIDAATVTRKAFEAVRLGLADSAIATRAVFLETSGYRFRTLLTEGEAIRVVDAKRFARGEESLLVLDAEWKLKADCFFQESAGDVGWGSVPVALNGRIQVYVPEHHPTNLGGELITARLRSDTSVFFSHGEPVFVSDPGYQTGFSMLD